MNLQFIRYFLALAETENFTRAAERVNVVQSTFSSGIKKLEEQLNCQLFYRDKRQVRLTQQGQALLPRARELMATWNTIEAEFSPNQTKELRLGLLHNVLIEAVLPKFNNFKSQHASFSITIEEGDVGTLLQKLDSEELHCILIKEEQLNAKQYSTAFIYEECLQLAIAPNHFLANKESVPLEALAGLPFIQRGACTLFDVVGHELANRNISIDYMFSTPNDETVKGLIASGVGCSLMSRPLHPEPSIRYIPLSNARFTSRIILVWRPGKTPRILEHFLAA